jgi:hypothetical protein
LTQINPTPGTKRTLALMAGIDWVYALSLAASLALAVGAICILLFAM